MKTFIIISAGILTLGLVVACSDDDNGQQADSGVSMRYGDTCAKDAECGAGVCEEKTCTKTCKKQSDCPSVGSKHFDCGEVTSSKTVCYARKYVTKTKGTMGHDCSVNKCAAGYLCTGQSGDADRYCAAECKADMDCPPRYRCATTQTGNKAVEAKKYCRLRKFCHPCALDDQCGPDGKCLKDKNGAGFCSKTCSPKTGTADGGPTGTCPVYAKCEKASGGGYYCVHRAGACFKSFKSEGAQCDPCIFHQWLPTSSKSDPYTVAESGQCKKGAFCVLYDRYTGESACLMPCATGDTCPTTDEMCFKFEKSLGGSFCMKWKEVTYSGTKYKTRGPCFK